MSFKICPILELLPSAANNGAEGGREDVEKVLSFAHISEENFLLVLMLTNKANLAIYYNTSSGSTSRCEKVPLGRLFPKQKLLNSHHPPILVALTEDASAVCLISADSHTIFLMPFSSLLDVTWGRSSTPLATKPIIFSILEHGDQGIEHSNNEGGNLPTAAICYHSAKAERTYLLFGNEEGALFLVDLHIKRLCLQIELKSGIDALSIFADFEADGEQKYLLINLFDNSQIVLPLETQSMQIRETFARIGAKDVHFLDPNLHYFPQKANNSICILEKENGTLRIHNSCSLNNSAQSKFVQLDQMPSKNIQHLLVTPHFVAILSEQNRIVLHIRFLQPNLERSNFSPIQIEEDGSTFEGGNLLGIVPSINNSFNILADTHPQTQQQKQKHQTDILLIIAQTGLYRLRAENSLDGFILDHLNAQQIYSTESLAKIAESLGPPVISPLQLCLSLLRSVLYKMQNNENQEKQNGSQIHGLLSIALSNNVELESLLKLLQEYGQTNLLIPFLCLKCERNPGDLGMRRLLLTAMLTKLSNLTSNLGRGESRNGAEGTNTGELENGIEKAKLELEGMEMELRNFLTKFGPCDQNILPILLRAHFWQCIFILLSRDPKGHSPAMARHLLEMPTWKCVPRLDGMLLCISFLHWPSMGAFTPTLLVKMFNLVPTLNWAQLRRVSQIAETLFTKMSMESALPLKLIVSMRLLGLEGNQIDRINSSDFLKKSTAYCPLACGPNCTVALVENAFDYGNGEEGEQNNVCQNRPMFWGEFVAGTSRMVNNEGQQKSPTKRMAGGENRQPKEQTAGIESTSSIWAKRRQKEESQFPLASIPIGLEFGRVESVKIIFVAAGTEHILLLSADGRLFSFGRNRFGQCGIGTNSAQQNLTKIHGNWPRPLQIFAGHYHSGMITENNEVWLWGWGLYGQLGNGHIRNCLVPNKSDAFSAIGQIKQICLGYAHTLALTEDGRVFGCGAISNGQLGIDPARLPENPQKICQPLQMQFPPAAGPIAQLASGYFHGLALTRGGDLFEWGECPQSLKMRMFLQKRLRAKQKQQERAAAEDEAKKEEKRRWNFNSPKSSTSTQKEEKHSEMGEKNIEEGNELVDAENIEEEEMNSSPQSSGKRIAPLPPGPAPPMLIEMPKSHLRIRRICKWTGAQIKMLSAGFNHSALLTTKGEIFTWGKSLEMQLGHGDRKEKAQPTRVEGEVKWANVICARNFTTALSAEGLIYIWGRNDRNQLGLGIAQQKPIRKILLKSEKGKPQKTVELPADNCVEKPTILTGLKVPMEEEEALPNEEQLESLLSTADQLSINALSRFLSRYPVVAFIAVQAHLMAGDLLSAIRTLATLAQKEGLISMEMNRADENTPGIKEGAERQISLITKVSQMSGGKNEPTIRRGIPPSTRIGTIKTTLGEGKNNEQNAGGSETSPSRRPTMGMGQSSRRVAVQMKKTYCCTSTQATNSQPFSKVEMQPPFTSTSSSSSPYRLTKVSISPSKSPQTPMQRNSSVEKNSTPSPSTFDSTTKFPNQQPKLSASSPSTISISGTNSSPKSMEKFYSLVDRIWNLLRIHPIREVQTMALLELLNAQFPVYNRLAADARLCRLVDSFVEFPTATSSSDSAALPTGQRRFFELSVRERQIALKKAVRPHLGSRRFQSLKLRCEQILAQDRFRYFNDCGHFEKCIVESGPSQSEMASLRNRTRQCTRCCNNSIGARRRSVESHQGRMTGANQQQKGSAFGGHPQSPASL